MPTKSDVLVEKDFPEAYPADAVKILEAMSFSDGLLLVGSMSLRSQVYAGDYDGYEVVKMKGSEDSVVSKLASRFKEMVRSLQKMKDVYIGDIKSGVVDEWRVIPMAAKIEKDKVVGYDAKKSHAVVEHLLKERIIDSKEASDAMKLLPAKMKPLDLLEARNNLKYHIVRWKPEDVLRGSKKLVDGRTFTLEESFVTPGIAKMDVIALVNNSRYTDFSVIYQFQIGDRILNEEPIKIDQSLRENIIGLKAEGNYFKAMKRMFALAKYTGDNVGLEALHNALNSDLGRIYHVLGDINTLVDLLERQPGISLDKTRFEIDQFIGRLANIYTLKDFIKDEAGFHKEIRKLVTLPRPALLNGLKGLSKELNDVLQYHSGKWLKSF